MSAEPASLVGVRFEVDVGSVAHGGHCVARHEGRVVFVRHALPGERAVVQVTEGHEGSRFLRAEAVSVVTASDDRVVPPCRFAHPGGCGGCDWQHASIAAQRRLKAAVVVEQMQRLGGVDVHVEVEAVPGDVDGLGWRTRVQYAVDPDGHLGFRRHRSHDVVPIDECLIAHPLVRSSGATAHPWVDRQSVEVLASPSHDRVLVLPRPAAKADKPGHVIERAAGRDWRVSGSGFWQVHPGAADALIDAVLGAVDVSMGESAVDLYSGVGLFAGLLGERVGPLGSVVAVESSAGAVRDARRNLHDQPQVRLVHARVDRWLGSAAAPAHTNVVVIDPPRSGAGRRVVDAVVGLTPRVIAYVACDPAALGRDTAYLRDAGYALTSLRGFDTFPMTHHVECVAAYLPA
ncbi:MAG: TRAM domain-containing protein [Candidatus Nanopelagicales bacterium]